MVRTPLTFAIAIALSITAAAQEPKPNEPLREIFVPFEDLNIILEGPTQRVFLTREEYDDLIAKAKVKPLSNVPHKLALVSAEYDAKLAEGRATITGNLTIEVLDEGLFALPLDLAGVGIRSAMLDDKAAPLIRDEHQRPVVLVQGKGSHKLVLSLTAPLTAAAAQQSLNVTLPTTTAARLKLAVPGNVEVKGGAAVIDRQYDKDANVTRLELLPQRGGLSLVMSLNNKLLQEQRVVVARSVLVDEVTQGYERIHATISHRVLHGAVEKLRFAVPAGFEVTRVESQLLARWEAKEEGNRKILELTLREPTSEQIVVEIAANRSPQAGQDWLASLADWKFPRLEPLDVAGQVAVVGLLVEDRLRPENLAASDLLPIDAGVLAGAIPASVLTAEPGAPDVRQVATYYAPAASYNLAARFAKPPAGLKVATNSLLILSDRGLLLTGGFALTPEAEDLFEFRFTAPNDWQVKQVTRPDGTPLAIERYTAADGGTRVLVRLVTGVTPGQTATVNFELLHTPAGWLADWASQKAEYPQLVVEGATSDTGAIAAQTLDDLTVRPDQLTGLTPLLDAEKAAAGLAELPTALAYRYQSRPFAAALNIERTKPSLMAEVYSFLRIEPDNLIAHYELNYDVREARTRRVYFLLPKDTPQEISIRGLGDTVVKEFRASDEGAARRWEVELADRKIGRVQLAVDFTQHYDELALARFGLPLVEATEVEYQSAFVAVEGDEELDITLTTTARAVDVGELSGGQYAVGRRVIGAYGYVGSEGQVTAVVTPRNPYALPPALVQKARLTTKVAASGRSQSLADFDLVTKATLLEVRLPPGSTLWTISLSEQPTKPQREGDSLLISLPAQEQLSVRTLRVVYETAGQPLGLAGVVESIAPRLLVRAAGTLAEREVPQADLDWTLHLPSGYTLRRSDGTVYTQAIEPHQPAAVKVAAVLYTLAGGINPWYASRQAAREAASFNNLRQLGQATQSYHDSFAFEANQSELSRTPAAVTSPATAALDEAMSVARDASEKADQLAAVVPPPTAAPEAPASAVPPPPTVEPKSAPIFEDATAARAAETAAAGTLQGRAAQVQGKMLDLTLAGVSSLRIDMQGGTGGQAVSFVSLGGEPLLKAAVIDDRRVHAAAWGLALLVGLVGVGLTLHSARNQAVYVITVLLAASVPLLLTEAFHEVAQVFDYVFYAGCLLAVYFPLAALVIRASRWVKAKLPAAAEEVVPSATPTVAIMLVALNLAFSANTANAQDTSGLRIVNLKDIIPLIEEGPGPVTVPPDAVVVPYDPEKPEERGAGQKLLVPYDKYVELFNQANPDKKIVTQSLPAEYALAGASYEATLAATDSLVIRGSIEIDVFSDKPVAVPLHLAGGVLVKATVDGAAAKLQVVQPDIAAVNPPAPEQVAKVAASEPAPLPPRMLLLHLPGKGRKKLDLAIQLGLTRQGGWRIVRGQLPAAPATALTLVATSAGTEIRQASLADRPTFETKAEGERIESSLSAGGQFDLQWRTKVTEGQVDQSLTAQSTAVLDVREDALRLVWQARLEFGRAFRDAFTFGVPTDYLIEQVSGENVRGWSAKTVGMEQMLDVTLLKPAQGTETVTIELSRRGRVGQGEFAEFNAPTVVVIDAALQQGQIAVRKSPRLDLRTVSSSGLSRADAAGQTAAVEQIADAKDAAVLIVTPYQTFRFVRMPAALRLAASEQTLTTTAEVRAALRVAERDTTLDAAVVFRPQGQPLYRAELFLPQGFELDRLGPGDLEWVITTENDRRKLTVQLLEGRSGEFTLTLFGRIVGVGDPPSPDGDPKPRTIPAPVIEVLGVQKQEGDLVVLPDPDTDVRLDNVNNADSVLLMQAIGWLAADQQPLAKAALRFRSANYGATLVLTPRTPQVSVRTITNVKITPRAVEETILLNFKIEQAGIRRLSFLLPASLEKARLNVKLLKSKTVEPATNAQGQPIPGWVRFKLELQDYVRDSFGVVVMHDRLLTTAQQSAAIPQVETGRTDQRLLAIENAGRDEFVPAENLVGFEQLSPQQQTYREMQAILQGTITQAYAVSESAAPASFTFQTRERARAETAAARIGLATTVLVVDAAGAYRGLQEYRVTNATEQFLEVVLPAGARLWTATVAGQPVKPVLPPAGAGAAAAATTIVRIPLVKTGEGEGDYPVQLKYGGQMPRVASLTQVRFPLMKTANINVEQSRVKLLLPDDYDWSRFEFGGTMRHVADESELGEVYQSYLNKRIQEAKELLSSANPYTRLRAQSNLKQSAILLSDSSSSMAVDGRAAASNNLKGLGLDLQMQNDALLRDAEQEIGQQAAQQPAAGDNRSRLNYFWSEQDVKRSKNVVSGLASNFDGLAEGQQPASGSESKFNSEWFDQNALGTKRPLNESGDRADPKKAGGQQAGGEGKPGGRYSRSGKPMAADDQQRTDGGELAQNGQNPQLFNKQQQGELQQQLQKEADEVRELQSTTEQLEQEKLSRYGMNQYRNAQQQELGGAVPQRQLAGQAEGAVPGNSNLAGGGQRFDRPSQPPSGGTFGGMGGFGGAMGSGGAQPGYAGPTAQVPVADPFGQPNAPATPTTEPAAEVAMAGEDFANVAAGLASLDLRLAERGRSYNFTTSRGQIEITARPVSDVLIGRLIGLAGLVAVVFVGWLATRQPAREAYGRLAGTVACGVLIAVLGLLSLITGVFPYLGLILVVVGIALAIRNRTLAPAAAAAAA
jgi:hypothetical protein